jgi:nuclear RNA export factor
VKTGDNYSFFVESPAAAASLKALDKKISLVHNFWIKIKVVPSPAPKHELNDEIRQKIKEIMAARYNAATKVLELKNFHNDPRFLGEAAYVPLARANVMSNVLRVIGENIPDIEAIDFSENKLPSLDHFSMLEDNAPNLKVLDLSNNRLSDVKELQKLSGVKLRGLNLKENTLDKRSSNREEYIERIRKIFPRLEMLDGEILPMRVAFEEDTLTFPMTQKLMAKDEHIKALMLKFFQQYFTVFDGDDRAPLIPAYHPNSMFSMSTAYPPGSTAHGTNKLTNYQVDARNLNLVIQSSKRLSFLKLGNVAVVKFLNDLPKTLHDLNSFSLDIPFSTERLITITVTGVFKERALNPPPLRHFNRCFIVVPQGSGFVIINETLFITNASSNETKIAFQENATGGASNPIMPAIIPANAQELVTNFCQVTNLRPDWAKKCLEETKWNLDGAVAVFQIAQKEGKIPAEAYAFSCV